MSSFRKALALGVLSLCLFVVVAMILLRILPGPHRQIDYMVAGTISVMVSLLLVFIVIVKTDLKGKNLFYKRRRPEGADQATGRTSTLL